MSAYGGRADVPGMMLKSPLIARRRHSPASKFRPLKGRNRPKPAIQGRCRERPLSDRKAVVRLPRSVRQLIANSGLRTFVGVDHCGRLNALCCRHQPAARASSRADRAVFNPIRSASSRRHFKFCIVASSRLPRRKAASARPRAMKKADQGRGSGRVSSSSAAG